MNMLLALQILTVVVLGVVRAYVDEPQGFATVGGSQFCQGVTIHGAQQKDVISAASVGSNCARVRIPWLVIQREPIRRSELCQTDPPDTLRQRCDQAGRGDPTNAANVRRACWEAEAKARLQFVEVDEQVYGVADPKFSLIGVLGEGFVWSLPVIDDDVSTGDGAGVRPLDVNTDGMNCYLNNLYVYAHVVVMRYKNVIKHWQLEDSLHTAAVQSKYFGWRSRAKGGIDHWSQKSFQDKVLKTLIRAVRDTNDDSLRITTALDTDLPQEALNALALSEQRGYDKAAADWIGFGLDYLSVLAFPCRFAGAFNGGAKCGSEVGARVAKLRAAVPSELDEDLDVVVMSTAASTCRTEHQVTVADAALEQAQFIRAAYTSSITAVVSGFFYAGTSASSESHVRATKEISHALWGLTDFGILSKHEQVASRYAYRAIGAAVERKDWSGLASWVASGGDVSRPGLSLLVGPFGLKDCVGVETDDDWALEGPGEMQPRASFLELKRMYREEPPLTMALLSETAMINREIGVRYH